MAEGLAGVLGLWWAVGLWWALGTVLSSSCCKKRKKGRTLPSDRLKKGKRRQDPLVWRKGKTAAPQRPLPSHLAQRNRSLSAEGTQSQEDTDPVNVTDPTKSEEEVEKKRHSSKKTTRTAREISIDRTLASSTKHQSTTTSSDAALNLYPYSKRAYRGLKPGTLLQEDVRVLVEPLAMPGPVLPAEEKARLLDAWTPAQRQKECAARLATFVKELPFHT